MSGGIKGELFVFPNGMVAFTDENGQQVPELQGSVPSIWAQLASFRGVNPAGVRVNYQSFNGVLVEDEYGWRVR